MIVRPVLCRPFVGRREELAYLNERRLEAGSSHGGLVLIAGDAGVGKSRIVAEFCSSLARSRWRVATGQCEDGANRPFGPILEILERLEGAPVELGGATTKREQQHAILARFAALAARRALVVTVEDAHWADAATLDFLAFLGPELGRMRVLVLVSFRPGDVDRVPAAAAVFAKIARNAQAARIDLAPFRGLELRTFIDGALDGIALPTKTLREIALAGEGNPFFTEELLKSAVESTSSERSGRSRRDVPQTVRATVLERLRAFDEREREIVAQAAVIGRTFALELLASTLETSPKALLPTLRRARDVQLVEELTPSTFRFRHGLTRDAIYNDFLRAELPDRHRAIALALESAPDDRSLEALAFHWWAAADGVRSARYNEAAGDEAGRVHAHEDAIVLYERALESRDVDARTRGSIMEKIARRRVALDGLSEARALYAAAADVFRAAGDRAREAASRSAAAIFAYQTNVPDPTAPLEAMLTQLDTTEYLARSRVHLGIAWIAATLWYPTEAARHVAEVDASSRAEAPDIRLRYHNVSAWVAMTIGDLETFRSEYEAWLAAAEALGSSQSASDVCCNGGMCYAFFGRHEEAREQLARGLKIARAAHLVNSEEALHAARVMSELLRGDLAQARAALDLVRASSESHFVRTAAMAWGSIVAAHLDDRRLIERWFDAFEATIRPEEMLECAGGFAELMVRRGRDRDAAELLHRAIPPDCEVIRGNVYSLLAVARYGFVADRPRARDYLARAAAVRHDVPERPALALFDALVHRHAGRTHEMQANANEAAAGFERLRMPLFEAAAREVAGDAAAALELFRACGATHDVRRLAGHATVAPALSPRERDVALLASDGLSNLEIARTLGITSKTVEKHLASVYRKLQITSRTRLSANISRQT